MMAATRANQMPARNRCGALLCKRLQAPSLARTLRIVRLTMTPGSTFSRGKSGSISATLLARRFTFRATRRVSLRKRWAAVDALSRVRRTAFFALPTRRAVFALADLALRTAVGRAAGRRVDFVDFFLVIAMVSLPPRPKACGRAAMLPGNKTWTRQGVP